MLPRRHRIAINQDDKNCISQKSIMLQKLIQHATLVLLLHQNYLFVSKSNSLFSVMPTTIFLEREIRVFWKLNWLYFSHIEVKFTSLSNVSLLWNIHSWLILKNLYLAQLWFWKPVFRCHYYLCISIWKSNLSQQLLITFK
jgi:hypothetical protein